MRAKKKIKIMPSPAACFPIHAPISRGCRKSRANQGSASEMKGLPEGTGWIHVTTLSPL